MPIVQIWVNEKNYEILRRLKAFLESKIPPSKRKIYSARSRSPVSRRTRQVKRKVNNSYVFNQALDSYWNEKENEVISFEKKKKH